MQLGKKIAGYIDSVCGGISSRKQRKLFRAELTYHLMEKVSSLMRENGMTQQQAEEEALRCIGDAQTVSDGINRVHNGHAWNVWKYICLAITCLLGFANFLAPYQLLRLSALLSLGLSGPNASVGVIGGADGPTAIYIAANPVSYLPLIAFFFFLALTLFLFLYPAARRSWQRKKK